MVSLHADIDARIEAIQHAPVEERFILMNALKKEMIHMQEAERIDAISKLKSITQSNHGDRAIKELQKYTKPKYHHDSERASKTKVRTEIEYEHENEAEDHIEDESEQHIEDETEDRIEDETENQIEHETEDHIEDETEEHIEDEHDDD